MPKVFAILITTRPFWEINARRVLQHPAQRPGTKWFDQPKQIQKLRARLLLRGSLGPEYICPRPTVDEQSLKVAYPVICRGYMSCAGSSFSTIQVNYRTNLGREFYVNWNVDDIEDLEPVRGRLIDISQDDLRRFLGALDVPVEPLIGLPHIHNTERFDTLYVVSDPLLGES
ncbi:hypothetical protein HAX54_029986 [Datura stramonium]|uniref:Uncharacterized protein n=1 Tax=Datura stramonium TaxID=4076 RepID=A0ABS8SAS9_DATST|nr:hypothetical protein [Datura stramonium]